jgi:uncharacterized protein (TIGR02145 family)
MSGTLAPVVTFTSCFDTITTIGAKPYKLKGGIPLGGTYSGPGVNSVTGVFNPALAGVGTHTITYSYTNAYGCEASTSVTIVTRHEPPFTCGNTLTDIRDDKTYPTVQIGSQCWMASNLAYGNTIDELVPQTDNCIAERYVCTSSFVPRTSFYQWDELMQYQTTESSQGLCPPGWHVPSESEWTTLFNIYQGTSRAGRPLQDSLINGFNAKTSGVYYLNSRWSFTNFATIFWSSTPWNATKVISHGMNGIDFSVSLYPSAKGNAIAVRCLRD